MNEKASYTAADSFPVKVLQDIKLLKSIVQKKIIPPMHVQLIPTNRCNLSCDFCSCSNEDRRKEMSLIGMKTAVDQLIHAGMRSVTVTGGGDPLMFPYVNYMFGYLKEHGISIGLVTNGLLLSRLSVEDFHTLTWCRISHGDDRDFSTVYQWRLLHVVEHNTSVDWAFSYVVSPKPNVSQILEVLHFANAHKFTHVRLVADLLQPQDVDMDSLKEILSPTIQEMSVTVIFQARNTPKTGGNCRICWLKPVITPDYKAYACCGAQYALDPPTKNFPDELCLGTVSEFVGKIKTESRRPFAGGEQCKCCYYQDYNNALEMLLTETTHKEFI